jgi:hypothetical protein
MKKNLLTRIMTKARRNIQDRLRESFISKFAQFKTNKVKYKIKQRTCHIPLMNNKKIINISIKEWQTFMKIK